MSVPGSGEASERLRAVVDLDVVSADVTWVSPAVVLSEVTWDRRLHPDNRTVRTGGVPALVMVRRGSCLKTLGGSTVVGDPMNATLFNAEDRPRVSHPWVDHAHGTDFFLDPDFIGAIVHEWDPDRGSDGANPFRTIGLPVSPQAYLAYRGLLARIGGRELADPIEVDELVQDVLTGLLAGMYGGGPPPPSSRAAAASRRIESRIPDIAALLSADPVRRYTLHELARRAGCTPWHLSRTFARALGAPISRYLCRLRLRVALDRMLDGDENLTSVALDAGFSSHAHFSFAFRTEFGRTPSDVRDTLRGRRSSASG